MDSHAATTTTSKPFQANCSSSSPIEPPACTRVGEMKRVTNETNVSVKFNLDGTGIADSTTGIPFLDHMLDHRLFDVHVRATGDTHIDDHHTNKDAALAIGTDLSGRPYLGYDLQIPTQRVGTYDTQLDGRNSHHIIVATFKAFARALRQATEYDPRHLWTVPREKEGAAGKM